MKLYSISTLLLSKPLFAQNLTVAENADSSSNQMLRALNTNSIVAADFPNAVLMTTEEANRIAGRISGSCGWMRSFDTPFNQLYGYYYACDNVEWFKAACEWRGDAADKPADTGTYSGWDCNDDDSVCFSSIAGEVTWWVAKERCEALGDTVNLAAPRTETEWNLAKINHGNLHIWLGHFRDAVTSEQYWVTGTGPVPVIDDSKSNFEFQDQDFVDDEYVQEDALLVLEDMFQSLGMFDGRRRKRDTANYYDTMSDLISRNGCWCPSTLVSGEHFPGSPLNPYDSACRKLSQCTHKAKACSSGECFTENEDAGFKFAYDVNDLSKGYVCKSGNECDTAMCMCIVEFGFEVMELVVDGGNEMTIDSADLNLVAGNDKCVVTAGTGQGVGGVC